MGDIDKPFSIREYVIGIRDKDISLNWPFSEECLEFFLKHGISKVLPPFETPESVRSLLCREYERSNCLNNCIGHVASNEEEMPKSERNLLMDEMKSEVSKHMCPISISSDTYDEHREESGLSSENIPRLVVAGAHTSTVEPSVNYYTDKCSRALGSTKRFMHWRKKRNRRRKKRLLVDIYAEARPCTLEGLDKISKSTTNTGLNAVVYIDDQSATKHEGFVNEVDESNNIVKSNNRHRSRKRFQKTRCQRGENASIADMLGNKRPTIKIKFSGCPSKPQKRKFFTFRTYERKARRKEQNGRGANFLRQPGPVANRPLQAYHQQPLQVYHRRSTTGMSVACEPIIPLCENQTKKRAVSRSVKGEYRAIVHSAC